MKKKIKKGFRNPKKIPPYLGTKILHCLMRKGSVKTFSKDNLYGEGNIKYWEFDEAEEYLIERPFGVSQDLFVDAMKKQVSQKEEVREINSVGKYPSYHLQCPAPFVAEIKNINIIGPHGMVVTNENEYLLPLRHKMKDDREHVLFESLYYEPKNTLKSLTPEPHKTEQTIECACSMLQNRAIPNTMSYAHWIWEKLPKLRGVEYYEEQTGKEVRLLIDPHTAEWQKELLRLCGFPESDWTVWNGGTATVERFVLPKWERREICGSDIDWLRKKLEKNCEYEEHIDKFSDRAYISRQNIGRRYISNFDSISSILDKYGFEPYTPENLSIEEQVALFKGANYLIGPTGSAFANLMFSNRSCVAIIFNKNNFTSALDHFEYATILNNYSNNICFHPIQADVGSSDNTHSEYTLKEHTLEQSIRGLFHTPAEE